MHGSSLVAEVGVSVSPVMLCILPRRDPGDLVSYVRRTGPFELRITANYPGEFGLPYGSVPRLLLTWLFTEAWRQCSPRIELGRSLNAFAAQMGIQRLTGGARGTGGAVKGQADRLFRASLHYRFPVGGAVHERSVFVTRERWLHWAEGPRGPGLPYWGSYVELDEPLFRDILKHPVIVDIAMLRALRRSPFGIDLYLWLCRKTYVIDKPLRLRLRGPGQLYEQLASDPDPYPSDDALGRFAWRLRRELAKICALWPELRVRYETRPRALRLWPSVSRIKRGR